MQRALTPGWFFCALVLMLTSSLRADAPEAHAPKQAPELPPAEAMILEAQAIIDAVLEYHYDPPTRQELWLAGAKAMLARVRVAYRPGLSAEISKLTTADHFAEFTRRLWTNDVPSNYQKLAPQLREAFRSGILKVVPGEAALVTRKEAVVQEQLQGNRYVGTGIALGSKDEFPQIAMVIPGGPMERAGGKQ